MSKVDGRLPRQWDHRYLGGVDTENRGPQRPVTLPVLWANRLGQATVGRLPTVGRSAVPRQQGVAETSAKLAPQDLIDGGEAGAFGSHLSQRQVGGRSAPKTAGIDDDGHRLPASHQGQRQSLYGRFDPRAEEHEFSRRQLREQAIGFGVQQEIIGSLPKNHLLVMSEKIQRDGKGVVGFDAGTKWKKREIQFLLTARAVHTMNRVSAIGEFPLAMRFDRRNHGRLVPFGPRDHPTQRGSKIVYVRDTEGAVRVTEVVLGVDVDDDALIDTTVFGDRHGPPPNSPPTLYEMRSTDALRGP